MNRLGKIAKPFLAATFKILLWPLIICVLYAVVRYFFDNATETQGLLSPERLNLRLLALAAATFLLRWIVLFILPPIVAFRLTVRLFGFLKKNKDTSERKVDWQKGL